MNNGMTSKRKESSKYCRKNKYESKNIYRWLPKI